MDGCRLFHQHSPREVNEGENRSLSLFMSRHAKPGEALRGEKRKEGLGNCMLLELHNRTANTVLSRSRKNEESVLLFALFPSSVSIIRELYRVYYLLEYLG